MSKVLAGVLPVLVTPFDESGGCDAAALANEVDFVISHGAHGVVLGMVSEVLRLSSEERDALTEATGSRQSAVGMHRAPHRAVQGSNRR